jgi:hypothetical protein
MNELAHVIELDSLLDESEFKSALTDFEAFFDSLSKQPANAVLKEEIEQRLADYFQPMELPDQVTLYDQILLSLRSKDVVASFNWDPLLLQAYRRNIVVEELPRIVFLHGNVGVGICVEHRKKGYIDQCCSKCGRLFSPAPLLYPVCEKDYTRDQFIANEWDEFSKALKYAFIFTIFGYSAPKTDVAARSLLLSAFSENTSRDFTLVEIIDIKNPKEIESNWQEFRIRENNIGIISTPEQAIMFRHTRRSCDALGEATLQGAPWRERPLPTHLTLGGLQEWIRPLVQEEKRYIEYDEAFKPHWGTAQDNLPAGK